MNDRRCRYCQQVFQPVPYRPQQLVCSQPECQRRRDYHRQKIASDPVYRQVCLESPRKWRQANPENLGAAKWRLACDFTARQQDTANPRSSSRFASSSRTNLPETTSHFWRSTRSCWRKGLAAKSTSPRSFMEMTMPRLG
jgi:hypothetical protein